MFAIATPINASLISHFRLINLKIVNSTKITDNSERINTSKLFPNNLGTTNQIKGWVMEFMTTLVRITRLDSIKLRNNRRSITVSTTRLSKKIKRYCVNELTELL